MTETLDIDPPAPEVQAVPRTKRAYTRQTSRQTARDPSRDAPGGVIVGRNGEVLSRKRTETGDIFDIPANLKEPGWDYQWCAVSVAGNSEILMDQNLMMAENGWRPVPSDRWRGRFMPHDHKGPIIRGQQMLMERPQALSEQARQEEYRKAAGQMRDRDQALMGRKADLRGSMPDGFAVGGRYRGTGGDIRMNIDPAVDAPMPQYELAEPGQ